MVYKNMNTVPLGTKMKLKKTPKNLINLLKEKKVK